MWYISSGGELLPPLDWKELICHRPLGFILLLLRPKPLNSKWTALKLEPNQILSSLWNGVFFSVPENPTTSSWSETFSFRTQLRNPDETFSGKRLFPARRSPKWGCWILATKRPLPPKSKWKKTSFAPTSPFNLKQTHELFSRYMDLLRTNDYSPFTSNKAIF